MNQKTNPNQFIAKIVLIVAVVALITFFKSIFLMILAAAFVTLALLRPVNFMSRHKVPRGLAAMIAILGVIAIFVGVVWFILPVIVAQMPQLIESLNQALKQISSSTGFDLGSINIPEQVSKYAGEAISFTTATIDAIASIIVVLFFTLYWLIDYYKIKSYWENILKHPKSKTFAKIVGVSEKNIGEWVKGQALLSLTFGVLVYITYSILGVPYAASLALLAGVFELIPYLGPVLATIPAVLLALTDSPEKAIMVIIAYIFLQSIESYVLAPKVMGGAVDLHPIIVLLAFMVAGKLAGLVGVFLAIPVTLLIKSALEVLYPSSVAAPPKPAKS